MPVKPVPTLGWRRETVAATILQVTQDQRDQMALRTRKLMETKHLTNVSLARKAEVAEKTVSRLINAKREPRYDTIERVAKALGVSAQDLMGTPPAPLGLGAPQNGDRLSRLEDKLDRILYALNAATDEEALQVRSALGPLLTEVESTPRTVRGRSGTGRAERKLRHA